MMEVGERSPPADPERRSVLNALLGGGVTGLLAILFYPIVRFVMPLPEEGGEVTRAIRERLLDVQYGRVEDTHGWLTRLV